MISRKNRAIDILLPKDKRAKKPKAERPERERKLAKRREEKPEPIKVRIKVRKPKPSLEEPMTWEDVPYDIYPQTTANKPKSKIGYDCEACGLFQQSINPQMPYSGSGLREILIIGEAPGAEEDRGNQPFIGQAGRLFRTALRNVGIDMERDCWITNSVRCRPPGNKKPTRKQQKCCYTTYLYKEIITLDPKFIILAGGTALETMFNGVFSNLSVSRWRGLVIPEQTRFNAWIMPVFHPSYILRNEEDSHLRLTWDRDLKRIASAIRKPNKPKVPGQLNSLALFTRQVYRLKEFDSVILYLDKIIKEKYPITFDYETSSIKPYTDSDPKVWTINVATSDFTIALPFDHPASGFSEWEYNEIKVRWKKILSEPLIKKTAHNLKFEDVWSRVVFGVVQVLGWDWCTMNTAHIIDSRQQFSGLKFQAYINFGVMPYDGDVKKNIRSNIDATGRNTLDQVDLDKLLLYGGLDAFLTHYLRQTQNKKIRPGSDLARANAFFTKGLKTLVDTQHNGFRIDSVYFGKMEQTLTTSIDKLEKNIESSKEAKEFEEATGRPFKRKTKDYSTKDLRDMFFQVLGLPSLKKTDKDFDSVDKEVLEQIKSPIARKIIQRRKLAKIRDTYLGQFRKESNREEIVNPFIDLHTAASYRSSSSRPNIQNQPKRDKETKKYVRDGIFPHWGDRLLEVDYGSLEVRIIACESKDPALVKYIMNPETDMHRDQAKNVFMLDDEQITEELRFYAKNGFVFPEFYGSWYRPCANNLWQNCMGLKTGEGISVKKHLRGLGIRNLDAFIEHVKDCEETFWSEFGVIKDWQLRSVDRYKKLGYVEMRFGFRRSGHLSFNQIVNGKIQGTAFHLLLYAMTLTNDRIKAEGLKSKVMWEIHDSIGISVNPKELGKVVRIVNDAMVETPKVQFDWINVPLDIDIEIGGINEPWSEVKKIDHRRYLKKKKEG